MQNKSTLEPLRYPEARLHRQEKISDLEGRIKTLESICTELNPYLPIPSELKMKLREFNIVEADDPFYVTNALLRLLEDAINELHILRPLSDEEKNFENLR